MSFSFKKKKKRKREERRENKKIHSICELFFYAVCNGGKGDSQKPRA